MKSHFIIYPAMVGALFFSCENKESDTYSESLKEHVAENRESVQDAVNLQNLEEAESLAYHEISESLGLPEPLVIVLQSDTATSVDKIEDVRKFTDKGKTYYEITFSQKIGEDNKIMYDDLGKIRSSDLKDSDK